jgi:hypothetical protein
VAMSDTLTVPESFLLKHTGGEATFDDVRDALRAGAAIASHGGWAAVFSLRLGDIPMPRAYYGPVPADQR